MNPQNNTEPTLQNSNVMNKNNSKHTEEKSTSKSIVKYLLLIAILLASVGATYIWQHTLLTNKEKQLASTQSKLVTSQATLEVTTKKLATAENDLKFVALPTGNEITPQCSKANNGNMALSALTPRPIDNYQAYVVTCIGEDIPSRVIAVKTKPDGSRSFAFGAATGEPICISGKALPQDAANNISKATKVPVCKSF
jgi:hypothetical protein